MWLRDCLTGALYNPGNPYCSKDNNGQAAWVEPCFSQVSVLQYLLWPCAAGVAFDWRAEVRGWTLEGRSHHLPQPSFCQQREQAKACGDLLWSIMADLIRMEKSVMPRGQWFMSFIVSLEQDVEDYAGDNSHLGKRRVLVNWSPIGDFPLNNTFTFIFTWCIYLVILMGLKVIKKQCICFLRKRLTNELIFFKKKHKIIKWWNEK